MTECAVLRLKKIDYKINNHVVWFYAVKKMRKGFSKKYGLRNLAATDKNAAMEGTILFDKKLQLWYAAAYWLNGLLDL